MSPLATSILVSYLARKCGIFSQQEEKMKLYRRGRQYLVRVTKVPVGNCTVVVGYWLSWLINLH